MDQKTGEAGPNADVFRGSLVQTGPGAGGGGGREFTLIGAHYTLAGS